MATRYVAQQTQVVEYDGDDWRLIATTPGPKVAQRIAAVLNAFLAGTFDLDGPSAPVRELRLATLGLAVQASGEFTVGDVDAETIALTATVFEAYIRTGGVDSPFPDGGGS